MKLETVKVKVPGHPNGEVIVNKADAHLYKKPTVKANVK